MYSQLPTRLRFSLSECYTRIPVAVRNWKQFSEMLFNTLLVVILLSLSDYVKSASLDGKVDWLEYQTKCLKKCREITDSTTRRACARRCTNVAIRLAETQSTWERSEIAAILEGETNVDKIDCPPEVPGYHLGNEADTTKAEDDKYGYVHCSQSRSTGNRKLLDSGAHRDNVVGIADEARDQGVISEDLFNQIINAIEFIRSQKDRSREALLPGKPGIKRSELGSTATNIGTIRSGILTIDSVDEAYGGIFDQETNGLINNYPGWFDRYTHYALRNAHHGDPSERLSSSYLLHFYCNLMDLIAWGVQVTGLITD